MNGYVPIANHVAPEILHSELSFESCNHRREYKGFQPFRVYIGKVLLKSFTRSAVVE